MKPLEILVLDLYQHHIASEKMTLKCVNPVSKKPIICDYDTAIKNKYDFVCLQTGLTFDDILRVIRINNYLLVEAPEKAGKNWKIGGDEMTALK